LAFAGKDGGELAVSRHDGSVWLLDAATGAILREAIGPQSGGDAGPDAPTWDGLPAPTAATEVEPVPVAISPDGSIAARREGDRSVALWNVQQGERIGEPVGVLGGPIVDLAFTGAADQVAVLQETGFGIVAPGAAVPYVGPLATGVVDGLRIVFAGDPSGFVVLSRNQGVRSLAYMRLLGFDLYWESVESRAEPASIAVAPDHKTLVIGYADGRIGIVDLGRLQPLSAPMPNAPAPPRSPAGTDPAIAMDIRSDGDAVAWFASRSGVEIRDLATGEGSTVPTGADVEALALSADGTQVATVDEIEEDGALTPRLVLREIADGEVVRSWELGAPGPWRVAIADDGSRIAVGGPAGVLRLLDVATGDTIWTAPDDPDRGEVTALAFASEGMTLLVGALSGQGDARQASVLSLDTMSGARRGEPIRIDADRVSAVATSEHACCIAVAAADDRTPQDGRVLLVDHQEGRVLGSLGAPGDNMGALRIVEPGSRLVSGGPVSGWFTWPVDVDAWASRACEIAGRDLTTDEWRTYLGDEPYQATCSRPEAIGD
jgi:WD40 repeat protein